MPKLSKVKSCEDCIHNKTISYVYYLPAASTCTHKNWLGFPIHPGEMPCGGLGWQPKINTQQKEE